jgi:Xaa-Pro aminopeptidase
LAEVARKVAIENGQEDNFIDYMAGHGMGTSQVEKPNINPSSEEPLLPNMYFSLEPMLVKTGFGTGTAESSIWVTGTGSERMMKFELRPWLKA